MACHKGFERCSYGPNSTCHREIWKALRFKKEREAQRVPMSREQWIWFWVDTMCIFVVFFEDDQTSEILRMFEFDFDIIFFLHIEASWKFIIKTLILDVLYNMVSQLHLANRWYEVSTTSGTSTALPTAVEFSSGVVFMCCFCFESFMEDSIKRENEG